MFGDPIINPNNWIIKNLDEVSKIASGITKGQKFNGKQTIQVPYMRVANVQDGYLDLTEIKTFEALPQDLEQLKLQKGDVLMTEGGDYDKLGRGAIWHGQIENCIHQNHIFRVRVNSKIIFTEFFANLLVTQYAKLYFLQCSKQTTNLATINMTQLKALQVPLPPFPSKKNSPKSSKSLNVSAPNNGKAIAKQNIYFKPCYIEPFEVNSHPLTSMMKLYQFSPKRFPYSSQNQNLQVKLLNISLPK